MYVEKYVKGHPMDVPIAEGGEQNANLFKRSIQQDALFFVASSGSANGRPAFY